MKNAFQNRKKQQQQHNLKYEVKQKLVTLATNKNQIYQPLWMIIPWNPKQPLINECLVKHPFPI